ncbi:MAG: class B sortase [Lachnospiraceae bacterium]|nr:class B sortase [Lachnospiraceae bacterium]
MKKKIYLAISIILILASASLGIYAAGYQLKKLRAERNYTALRDEARDDEEGRLVRKQQWNGIEIPDKALNWAEIKMLNQDIYGYIYIPGTRVDTGVLQNAEDPSFYLTHKENREESANGAVYTKNSPKDFSASNTVIYGNDPGNGECFSTLNYLEDADFFDRSPYIFIYTPIKIYIFEIFAAYRYDGSEIRDSFSSGDEFKAYIEDTFTGKDMNARFRRDTRVRLDEDSRIISCLALDGDENGIKYVVCAVLLNGQ